MKTFIDLIKQRNEVLYYFGLVCFVAALLCLVLTRLTQTQVMSTNAWYKPAKFFLSTAIFVWSMAWYAYYLGNIRAVTWYSWGLIALFGFEDLYIALQAGRGQLSHFNISTLGYAGVYGLMALVAVGISLWTAYIGVLFFRADLSELSSAYVWGIRLGIIVFVIFSMQGLVMGSRLTHTIGGPDGSPGLPAVNWSRAYGDLRVAHFMGMHALQVLPILAYYVLRNVTLTLLVGLLYGIVTTLVFIQAMHGKSLFR